MLQHSMCSQNYFGSNICFEKVVSVSLVQNYGLKVVSVSLVTHIIMDHGTPSSCHSTGQC